MLERVHYLYLYLAVNVTHLVSTFLTHIYVITKLIIEYIRREKKCQIFQIICRLQRLVNEKKYLERDEESEYLL